MKIENGTKILILKIFNYKIKFFKLILINIIQMMINIIKETFIILSSHFRKYFAIMWNYG